MCTNVKKPTTVWASEGAEKLKRLKMLNPRGLFWCQKIESGQVLNNDNIRIARPNHGMCPSKWEQILGKKVNRRLEVGDPIRIQDIAD